MHVEIESIARLLSGRYKLLPIGSVPDKVRRHLGSRTRGVYLSTETAIKILNKHGNSVDVSDLLVVPNLLERGLWIADEKRPLSCAVSYFDPNMNIRFVSAVKVTRDLERIFLTTFHRAKKRQTKSLLRRGGIIRRHL